MALIRCSECKSEVSDKAAACPKCGNPMASAVSPPVAAKQVAGSACPFCGTNVPSGRTVCTGCRAWYGYMGNEGPAQPFKAGVCFLIMLVVCGAIVLNSKSFSVWLVVALCVGFLCCLTLLRVLWTILRGKKWWQYTRLDD